MNELVIFNKIKWLISYSDKYVFNSFTKVHINLKIRYQDRLYSLLENCIRSNTNIGNIRVKYQKEMLIDISLIDYYIGEAYDKKIIKKNRFSSVINSLNEIRKMTYSWSIINEEKKWSIWKYDFL